jgi:hypothetical protein
MVTLGVEQLLEDPAHVETLQTPGSLDLMIGKYLAVTFRLTGSTGA